MSSSDSRLKSMVVHKNRYHSIDRYRKSISISIDFALSIISASLFDLHWTYMTYPFFVCELLVKRILLQKKFGGKFVSYRNYN